MDINFSKLEVKDFTLDRYKEVYPEKEGMRLVKSIDDLFGFVNNETGEEQIPCIYPYAESFSEGKALVKTENNKFNYINHEGIIVVGRLNVTHAASYHENRAKVGYGTGSHFIDQYGNSVSTNWEKASNYSEGLALVHPLEFDHSEKSSVIDIDGKIVFSLPFWCRFEDFDLGFYGGYAPIVITNCGKKKHGRYEIFKSKAFVDKTGKIFDDADEVKRINDIYTLARANAEQSVDKPLNPEKLISYCSTITYPGGTVTLKASTEEELIEQKREIFSSLAESLNALQQQISEASANNVLRRLSNPKEDI